MMEDLRSRLHDSNAAIASLLEKSMDSEKTIARLRAELETTREENVRLETAAQNDTGLTDEVDAPPSPTGSTEEIAAVLATETID